MARTATVSSTEVLAGLVERVTFHNDDNGFCVLRIKARGQRDLITVLGHAVMIAAGEFVQASGTWVNAIRSAPRDDSKRLYYPCKTAQTPQRPGDSPASFVRAGRQSIPRCRPPGPELGRRLLRPAYRERKGALGIPLSRTASPIAGCQNLRSRFAMQRHERQGAVRCPEIYTDAETGSYHGRALRVCRPGLSPGRTLHLLKAH
jgi:hypothetical protein